MLNKKNIYFFNVEEPKKGDHQLFDYKYCSKYIFYVQHKKESHTGSEQHEGE